MYLMGPSHDNMSRSLFGTSQHFQKFQMNSLLSLWPTLQSSLLCKSRTGQKIHKISIIPTSNGIHSRVQTSFFQFCFHRCTNVRMIPAMNHMQARNKRTHNTNHVQNEGISIKRESMYIASGFLIWTFPVLENLVIFITCPIKIYYCYFITLITGFNIGKTVHIMAFLKIELALHALICALCDRETGVHNNNNKYTIYVIICKQMLTVASAPWNWSKWHKVTLLSSQYSVSCSISWLPKNLLVISMCCVMPQVTSALFGRCVGMLPILAGHAFDSMYMILGHVLETGDLDLWPINLTFKVDLDIIKVHPHAKFH